MTRTCKCGCTFEWNDLGQLAEATCNKILSSHGKPPLKLECPACRSRNQLSLAGFGHK